MGKLDFRKEKDSLGEVNVPKNRHYGAQTARALQNFQIGKELIPDLLIKAIVLIKKVAAMVNLELKVFETKKALATIQTCEEILQNYQRYKNDFPLTIWQSGSGTQTNMNVNEVIANLAKIPLHPNDDVNMSQSTNDVFPTAMHLSTVWSLKDLLLPSLLKMRNVLKQKEKEFKNIIKIGRTHLQDATPITLGQEFSGYRSQIEFIIERINNVLPTLYFLAQGATAVGTGLNAHPDFGEKFSQKLKEVTKIPFSSAKNKFSAIAAHDVLVNVSGVLNTLAASLTKIANDIRLLGSGPRAGLGELVLPENEPGSSIMPGKVNPTQCEVLIMICSQVMGNHVIITIAGAHGQLELNVNKPVIIYNLLQSINLLAAGINSLTDKCLLNLKADKKKIAQFLKDSLMLVTALNPRIGYDKVAKISQKARRENKTLRESAIELGFLTADEFDKFVDPQKMI